MGQSVDWQLHANVNEHGEDVALRVTLSAYDRTGYEVYSETWRGRDSHLPLVEEEVDTAWFLLCLLTRLVERAGSVGRINARVDPTLF